MMRTLVTPDASRWLDRGVVRPHPLHIIAPGPGDKLHVSGKFLKTNQIVNTETSLVFALKRFPINKGS